MHAEVRNLSLHASQSVFLVLIAKLKNAVAHLLVLETRGEAGRMLR